MRRHHLLLASLSGPAALLLCPLKADALLTYNIFQSGADVVVQTSGSLTIDPSSSISSIRCNSGAIGSSVGTVCTGPSVAIPYYSVTGPSDFNGTVSIANSTSVSGIPTFVTGSGFGVPAFGIDSTYSSGTPIVSSATFAGTTLAGLGFTTTGLIATWQLTGTEGLEGQIDVVIGEPAFVPGPLPLFGAAAAFGWSRRLRRRLSPSSSGRSLPA